MIAILLLLPREAQTKEEEGRIHLEARAPLPGVSYTTLGVKTAPRGVGGLYDENVHDMVQEIIRRESGGNPKAKNPKSTAYGLCQFLDGTWAYVQKKWDMQLERENPQDQLYACDRLYREEGISHWITSFPEYETLPHLP